MGVLTFDGGCYALVLKPLDVLGSQLARQQRILREGLEVPAAQRMAVHAHGRREEHLGGAGTRLVREVLPDLVQEVLVPRGGERDATGEEGSFGASDEDAAAGAIGTV